MVGSHKYDKENLGSFNGREFLDWLKNKACQEGLCSTESVFDRYFIMYGALVLKKYRSGCSAENLISYSCVLVQLLLIFCRKICVGNS